VPKTDKNMVKSLRYQPVSGKEYVPKRDCSNEHGCPEMATFPVHASDYLASLYPKTGQGSKAVLDAPAQYRMSYGMPPFNYTVNTPFARFLKPFD